ncbi:flagellar basal body rod protein FlgB [Sulfitobacter sp. THAF37]|uniref:FlgB family protein n=1 Tax=Sulfitobacter sp. THAF37 TaxID=2587855 RepID=UPI001268F16C|nr:FlgB family protein [Sulfitobacter sp. THAF37]QFT58362.1 flagellar basal body rod protein FlgB [Sulfitobacter sp. THAF37]
MFENLEIFRMSAALARYGGQKQAVIAQNVANADTPGYRARDLPAFDTLYTQRGASAAQKATRAGHMNGAREGQAALIPVEAGGQDSPNGNQVSLETEMLKSVEAKRSHDRALAIYKSSLGILRSAIRT